MLGSVVLGVLAGGVHSDSAYLYPWGFAAAACAAGAVVLAAARADSVFARVMAVSWLRWIEEPLRRPRPRSRRAKQPSRLPRVAAALAVLAVLVGVWRMATADGGGNSAADQITAGERAVHNAAAASPSPHASVHPRTKKITALGDSAMLASAPALEARFPGIAIDAQVGRQLAVAPGKVLSLSEAGHLDQILLIGLGTNGVGGRPELEQVVREAGHRTVVLVTVHGPVAWNDRVNSAIRQTARAHSNVVVAD